MTATLHPPATTAHVAAGRWTTVLPWAAAAWSAGYAALATGWALGAEPLGLPVPFGRENDPRGDGSILVDADPQAAAAVLAVLCLAGVAVAGLLAARPLPRPLRLPLLGFAAAAAAALALLLPDFRLLAALGYVPLFVVGAPFGWPPVSYADAFDWPTVNLVVCTLGGLLWAGAAAGHAVRSGTPRPRWATPSAARRWGRWATGLAALVPLVYALDRICWVLGIPLGIDHELLADVSSGEMRGAALGLGLAALGGAVLTLGLAQRWGEVFPRWIPVLRGRSVPPAVAIVPAGLVSVLVLSAGLMVDRLWLTGFFGPGQFPAFAAMTPWPLWGLSLGAATYAYHLRRRG